MITCRFVDLFSDLYKALLILHICQAWLYLLFGTECPEEIAETMYHCPSQPAACHICFCKTSFSCLSHFVNLGYKMRMQTGPAIKAFQEL